MSWWRWAPITFLIPTSFIRVEDWAMERLVKLMQEERRMMGSYRREKNHVSNAVAGFKIAICNRLKIKLLVGSKCMFASVFLDDMSDFLLEFRGRNIFSFYQGRKKGTALLLFLF
jgi:hypothetical protein